MRTRRTSQGLYGGFVGVAWAIEHVATSDDPDPLAEIDATLVRMLEQRSPWKGSYDLIEGLVGLGIYGLERLPRASGRSICGLVVERLTELAEPQAAGVAWHTPSRLLFPLTAERFPDGWHNLGMAHGSPGVVAFLGGCLAAGVAEERSRPLLEDAVAWVLAERLDAPGGNFPEYRAPGDDPVPARTAWCYGDPGVAAALLVAGRSAGRADWEDVAVEVALDAAPRALEEAGVVDTSLCHGAAGLAHLYARMHHTTGVPALADAARTWYGRVFEVPDHVDDHGTVDRGFLMGQGGVALALLGGLEQREPTWDRLLALSTVTGHGHG